MSHSTDPREVPHLMEDNVTIIVIGILNLTSQKDGELIT